MVETRRFELLTPLLARQVLSQLSYAPMSGYALVSIIHSEESVIFLKLYLCLALFCLYSTPCVFQVI